METRLHSHLGMLGAAPETRGSIASVVEAYRAHGLFKRWPIDYIAVHGDGGALRNVALAAKGLRRFAELLGRHRRVVLHAHCAPRAGFWSGCGFVALAAAARESVRLRFAPERTIARLEEIYADVGLASTGQPPARVRDAALREAA
jgi:hypothetical protein